MAEVAVELKVKVRPDLEPCPFCGGEAAFGTTSYSEKTVKENGWKQAVFHHVNCISCGATSRGLVGQENHFKAAFAWNRRRPAGDPAQLARLETRLSEAEEVIDGAHDAIPKAIDYELPLAQRLSIMRSIGDGYRIAVYEAHELLGGTGQSSPRLLDRLKGVLAHHARVEKVEAELEELRPLRSRVDELALKYEDEVHHREAEAERRHRAEHELGLMRAAHPEASCYGEKGPSPKLRAALEAMLGHADHRSNCASVRRVAVGDPPRGSYACDCGFAAVAANAANVLTGYRQTAPPGPLKCGRCGGPHRFDTSVPSPLWNAVVRAQGLSEYLCASCVLEVFVLAGESFTATLWSDDLKGDTVEVLVHSRESLGAALLVDENTRLRVALEKYGEHKPVGVGGVCARRPGEELVCSCGLKEELDFSTRPRTLRWGQETPVLPMRVSGARGDLAPSVKGREFIWDLEEQREVDDPCGFVYAQFGPCARQKGHEERGLPTHVARDCVDGSLRLERRTEPQADGADRPAESRPDRFVCPRCSSVHDRGPVNGVDSYRCLHCGYTGPRS